MIATASDFCQIDSLLQHKDHAQGRGGETRKIRDTGDISPVQGLDERHDAGHPGSNVRNFGAFLRPARK